MKSLPGDGIEMRKGREEKKRSKKKREGRVRGRSVDYSGLDASFSINFFLHTQYIRLPSLRVILISFPK